MEQALLAAAARLLTEEGPEALSVRRVAAEAGVSAMGVYSRFGGKQGLVEALFLDGFARLQQVLAAVPRTGDPVEDLLEGSRRYRRFALESPAAYAVMFSRAIPEFVPSAPCKLDAAGAFGVLVDAVRRGIDAGALAAGRPRRHRRGDLGHLPRPGQPRAGGHGLRARPRGPLRGDKRRPPARPLRRLNAGGGSLGWR